MYKYTLYAPSLGMLKLLDISAVLHYNRRENIISAHPGSARKRVCMVDRIGQRIENYRLIKLLGRGQFGEVYLGEQIYDKSLVAIKTLAHFSPENAKGFINEASTNFKLRHPHIVKLLSFGIENDDTAFLVMTYAPHGSLRTRLPQGNTISNR